jgi:hypothetical protein
MLKGRGKRGLSRLAVPAVIVVILVVAGAYAFLTRNQGTSSSSQGASQSSPNVQLKTVVNQFVSDVINRNVDGLTTFYTQSSVVKWSGNTGGISGLYTGTPDIKLIYATTVAKTTHIAVNSSKYTEQVFSPTHVNATFHLHMLANSSAGLGTINATIDVSQEWSWGGVAWHISRENWAYTQFDSSEIDLQHYPPVTTFPQWAMLKEGQNPDLVSEKSFEWHAGPYVAAAVYAFLLGMVAFAFLRFRSMGRRAASS